MNKVFDYRCGPTGGDCTSPYYVTLFGKPTLKDCVDQVVSSVGEWGSISVTEESAPRKTIAEVDYRKGDITSGDICENLLNRIVIAGSGQGGWSMSCYTFVLKGENNE